MYGLSAILLSSLSCYSLVTLALRGYQQEPVGFLSEGEVKHTLRPATEDDLDDIVTVSIDAFKPAAIWQYYHVDDDRYANYTWTCLRRNLQEQWDHLSASAFVNVVAVPQHERQVSGRSERVVSYAAWLWINREQDEASLFSPQLLHAVLMEKCSDHLDVNVTRVTDLEKQLNVIQDRYVNNSTEPQLYLGSLGTHPDWDGHGFAAEQVEVGLREAALAELPVTLIATPAGYPVYDSLGFRSLANITIAALDGLGPFWLEYMRWDAEERVQ